MLSLATCDFQPGRRFLTLALRLSGTPHPRWAAAGAMAADADGSSGVADTAAAVVEMVALALLLVALPRRRPVRRMGSGGVERRRRGTDVTNGK